MLGLSGILNNFFEIFWESDSENAGDINLYDNDDDNDKNGRSLHLGNRSTGSEAGFFQLTGCNEKVYGNTSSPTGDSSQCHGSTSSSTSDSSQWHGNTLSSTRDVSQWYGNT